MALVMDAQKAYDLLNVPFNDPIDRVKKQFRLLAKANHPDKNKTDPNAHEKYMELQKAYNYLVEFKYDATQKDKKPANESIPEQAPPNEFDLKLTLEEIFQGCLKSHKIVRKVLNPETGEVQEEEKVLQVQITPGIGTGARLTVEKEGDSHIGRIPANVVFIVGEEPHKYFRRSRFHLEYIAKLTSEEACLGHVQIPTLENEFVPLEVDELITPNTVKRILERGLPHPSGKGARGDIVVRFEIIYDTDKPQDSPMEIDLFLTLEQILHGCKKNVKVNRSITDMSGDVQYEDVFLAVDIAPGTKEGTPFTFNQKGDKRPETIPSDIIFTARDKPHPYFKRYDANLEYTIMVTPLEAQEGKLTLEVPTLESEKLTLEMKSPIKYGATKTFQGYGLPFADEPKDRGDLIVRFDILKNNSVEPPVECDLELSLENILTGCTKRRKITRKIFDSDGNEMLEEKIVEIEVKPGTEEGTEYRFVREGDRLPGSIPADIIFVAYDKPHDTFTRKGVHIEYVVKLTQSTFSTGGDYMVPTLEKDEEEKLNLDNIMKPSTAVIRFPNRGLPYSKNPDKRGDLIVTFDIIENPQDPPVMHELYLPVEQLQSGITKKLKITRKITDIDGDEETEDKILSIEIPQDTQDGTRIPFPQMGDQRPGKIPSDIIFVIKSKIQDPPVETDIQIPLQNVLNGCTKRLKIRRMVINDEDEEEEESKIVTLDIKPGVEEGTRFIYPKEGDQLDPHRIPADVVFIVYSKPHDLFKRNGVDLEYAAKISKQDSLNGTELSIQTLDDDDDENIELKVEGEIDSKTVRRIEGKGLPYPNDEDKRGDLVVRFKIESEDSSDSEYSD